LALLPAKVKNLWQGLGVACEAKDRESNKVGVVCYQAYALYKIITDFTAICLCGAAPLCLDHSRATNPMDFDLDERFCIRAHSQKMISGAGMPAGSGSADS